jgi:HSP20 family protein
MNALARWNQSRWKQLNGLEDLQQGLRRLRNRHCVHWSEQPRRAPGRIPLVAVSGNARGYLLKAELPGVEQEDAKIAIEDGTLTVTGDRTFDLNRKRDHRVEHARGRFAHRFEVPADARPAKVSAVFKNGVLMVHLAKNSVSLSLPALVSSCFPTLGLSRKDRFNGREHAAKS